MVFSHSVARFPFLTHRFRIQIEIGESEIAEIHFNFILLVLGSLPGVYHRSEWCPWCTLGFPFLFHADYQTEISGKHSVKVLRDRAFCTLLLNWLLRTMTMMYVGFDDESETGYREMKFGSTTFAIRYQLFKELLSLSGIYQVSQRSLNFERAATAENVADRWFADQLLIARVLVK